jgi:hypothetical protein
MADDALWQKTDHVCRVCFGRVYRRPDLNGGTVVQCSNCGIEAVGTHKAICCCGLKRGPYEKVRCIKQDQPTPEFPAEVIAAEVP